jgi:DNA-binding MarR family transcriptional regulator
VRQAALKAAIAALPDAALDRLEQSLKDPLIYARHLNFRYPRIRLLLAVAKLAPVQVITLARYLKRDRSNTFRSLQALVSLGLVARYHEGSRVFYRLPDPFPLPADAQPPQDG